MKTEFDFYKIARREPYSVPDDFYASLENKILAIRPVTPESKHNWRRILSGLSSAAVAAAILALCVLPHINCAAHSPCSIEEVERKFAQLQIEDKEFMLETYEDDIFLTQMTEE